MKNTIIFALLLLLVIPPIPARTQSALGGASLALKLRRLQTIASMLHTAAHPDDESTDLLVYNAQALGARVAYLSLNRGEGGQNGIGPELGEALGVIRTEELLASRNLDGAEQFFTRAYDFGFTRSPEETLQKWNKDEILGDMVRVIRRFRPMIVVNGFSGTGADGHGQHQIAGRLTPEAIAAAADPNKYPEQITKDGLQPWSVLKVYARRFGSSGGARAEFDVGTYDLVLGRSYAEIAAEGRSKHRSQDFGLIQPRGSQVRSYPRLKSDITVPELEKSIFDGIDVSITGIAQFAGKSSNQLMPSLRIIKDSAEAAIRDYRIENTDQTVSHLVTGLREIRSLRSKLETLTPVEEDNVDLLLEVKEQQFNDAIAEACGVKVDALSDTEIVSPGESTNIAINVFYGRPALINTAATVIKFDAPSGWNCNATSAEDPSAASSGSIFRIREKPDAQQIVKLDVPPNAQPTQPYWLVKPRVGGQFQWDSSMPVNLPFAPPSLKANVQLDVKGEKVIIQQPVQYRFADKTFGEIRRDMKIAPRLTLTMQPSLLIVPKGEANKPREISVEIAHNARTKTDGSVKLILPEGWKSESTNPSFSFTRQGEKTSRSFKIIPPLSAVGAFDVQAVAIANDKEYKDGYSVISYPHIKMHYIYHPAVSKMELFDVKTTAGLKVGYIPGSGDDTEAALQQIGVNVKRITPTELATGDLSGYDTIVLGIRAYEVNDDVISNNKRLLDYVFGGGNLIVQYNKQEFTRGNFAPYPVLMQRSDRITDENAPITVLVPDHPLFKFPNKIGEDDWKGWNQERGLYFLSEWDSRYTPLLSAQDEFGTTLKGGQLVTQYGKGTYIYSAYSWFRQFPSGVPGAYRIFANMVNLPKAK